MDSNRSSPSAASARDAASCAALNADSRPELCAVTSGTGSQACPGRPAGADGAEHSSHFKPRELSHPPGPGGSWAGRGEQQAPWLAWHCQSSCRCSICVFGFCPPTGSFCAFKQGIPRSGPPLLQASDGPRAQDKDSYPVRGSPHNTVSPLAPPPASTGGQDGALRFLPWAHCLQGFHLEPLAEGLMSPASLMASSDPSSLSPQFRVSLTLGLELVLSPFYRVGH